MIRKHTEAIRPPRALWVPFALGRPLGAPENPPFQRRVLVAALELLDAAEGPILVDFPEEEPGAADSSQAVEGWACPINFAARPREQSGAENLREAFRREVAELRPWYDLSVQKHDRTAVGEFAPDSAMELIYSFAFQDLTESAIADLSPPVALRLAVQDLTAFYFEALTARPGTNCPTSDEFKRWFWKETAAGHVLRIVKERCIKSKDTALRRTGAMFLIPMDQA